MTIFPWSAERKGCKTVEALIKATKLRTWTMYEPISRRILLLEVPLWKTRLIRSLTLVRASFPWCIPIKGLLFRGEKSPISGPPTTKPYRGLERRAWIWEVLHERRPSERAWGVGRKICPTNGSLTRERRNFLGGGRRKKIEATSEGHSGMSVYRCRKMEVCTCRVYFLTVPPLGGPWRKMHSALHSLYSVSCHMYAHKCMWSGSAKVTRVWSQPCTHNRHTLMWPFTYETIKNVTDTDSQDWREKLQLISLKTHNILTEPTRALTLEKLTCWFTALGIHF